ncbi:DDE Tnp IS1595 domain-containing protein, partial [Aphis craccivora]
IDIGYVHKTVSHQLHFIDPETRANSQSIVYMETCQKCSATNLLERQLMEEWWRSLNASKNLFDQIFEDIKKSSLT